MQCYSTPPNPNVDHIIGPLVHSDLIIHLYSIMYKTNIPKQHPFIPTGGRLMRSNHSHLVTDNQGKPQGKLI